MHREITRVSLMVKMKENTPTQKRISFLWWCWCLTVALVTQSTWAHCCQFVEQRWWTQWHTRWPVVWLPNMAQSTKCERDYICSLSESAIVRGPCLYKLQPWTRFVAWEHHHQLAQEHLWRVHASLAHKLWSVVWKYAPILAFLIGHTYAWCPLTHKDDRKSS